MPESESIATDARALEARAQRLAERETTGASPDQRVRVRVRADGELTGVSLSDDVHRWYDDAALAELVTRTIRGTQRRSRTAYERAIDELYRPTEPTPGG